MLWLKKIIRAICFKLPPIAKLYFYCESFYQMFSGTGCFEVLISLEHILNVWESLLVSISDCVSCFNFHFIRGTID
jgi:hypothetical protein